MKILIALLVPIPTKQGLKHDELVLFELTYFTSSAYSD